MTELPEPTPEPKNFQSVLDSAGKHPEQWQLRLAGFEGGPRHLVPCPPSGVQLLQHLRTHNVPEGVWSVTIVAHPSVLPATGKSARHRLKRHGPLSTVIRLGEAPPREAKAQPAAATPAPSAAASVEALRVKIAERQLSLQLLQLEADEAALRRSLRPAFQEQQPAAAVPATPPAWIASLFSVALPIIERVVGRVMESAQKREEVLTQLLAVHAARVDRDETPAAAATPDGVGSLRDAVSTIRELVETVGELGIGGEPSLATTVAKLAESLGPMLMQQQQQQQPRPLPRSRPRPQGDPMHFRIVQWLLSVKTAAEQRVDPAACADELEHAFLLLPEKFRLLLLSGRDLDSIAAELGGVGVPDVVVSQLRAALAQPPVRQWVGQFLRELAAPADDEGLSPEDDADSFANVPAEHDDD